MQLHPLTHHNDTPEKCPHCSCLQPNGTFLDLFRKLDFLRNEPQAKEKKARLKMKVSQKKTDTHTQETSSIPACLQKGNH